jgi:hypothetical protein
MNKEELSKEFKPLVREQKIAKYEKLVDHYNDLVDAFNEILVLVNKKNEESYDIKNSIDTINAVFRRLGYPDRVVDTHTLGSTVSNFLWKTQHVHQARPMPEVQKQGQPSDLFER